MLEESGLDLDWILWRLYIVEDSGSGSGYVVRKHHVFLICGGSTPHKMLSKLHSCLNVLQILSSGLSVGLNHAVDPPHTYIL
jgi:hypothetical protein